MELCYVKNFMYIFYFNYLQSGFEGRTEIRIQIGRAVAQAVSRWLPTAAARVCVRAACGFCGGQNGTGGGFLRILRFPLPIIPPMSPSS
jgi:hypothetical protein